MSQFERVATLCREQLEGRSLAHTFDPSIIKSYISKNKASQGNAFLIALKTADMMIEQYKPATAPELEQYDPFF